MNHSDAPGIHGGDAIRVTRLPSGLTIVTASLPTMWDGTFHPAASLDAPSPPRRSAAVRRARHAIPSRWIAGALLASPQDRQDDLRLR